MTWIIYYRGVIWQKAIIITPNEGICFGRTLSAPPAEFQRLVQFMISSIESLLKAQHITWTLCLFFFPCICHHTVYVTHVLSSLINSFCSGHWFARWQKSHPFHGIWLEAQSTVFKQVDLHSHIHHWCHAFQPIICSVKHTQRQNHAQKDGCWLLADLFTQPCSLAPEPQPDSSSCAEASGWGCCQAGATWGVSSCRHPSPPYQTGAHLGKRRGVREGWPRSHSQSVSRK